MSLFFPRDRPVSPPGSGDPGRVGRTLALLGLAALTGSGAGAQSTAPTPARPKLVYAGDAYFPPFEYKDAQGRAQGFNILFVSRAAEEAGYDVEFRLGAWAEAVRSLDEGRADLAAVAYSGERAARYDFLSPIWNMNLSLVFPAGRASYPGSLDELAGERVALLDRGFLHEALLKLPPEKQPRFRLCADHFEAMQKLIAGEATMVAGNGLTLRHIAAQLGLRDLVEVDVAPASYYLAALKGRGAELKPLAEALEKIRASPRMSGIVESTLTVAPPPVPFTQELRKYAYALVALLLVTAGAFAWSALLQREVRARTLELERGLAERQKLTAERDRFFEVSQTLHVVLDNQGSIRWVSPASHRILGRAPEEFVGTKVWEHFDLDEETARREVLPRLKTGASDIELKLKHRDGSTRWTLWNAAPDPRGELVFAAGLDISERRNAEHQIEHLAYHDALTGLPNRHLFVDRLDNALTRAQRTGETLAVLFVDLDHFKSINDSLGHTAGDVLLRAVALRLRSTLRIEDTVARLGGDEFTILVSGVKDPNDVLRLAHKLHSTIKAPVDVAARELTVSASIGVGLFPQDGETAEQLLRNADLAMYRAKELGRDRTQFYTAAMSARLLEHMNLEARLRRALGAGELFLAYQPILRLATLTVEAREALLRWRDPDRGTIHPSEFIGIAETTNLISEIGHHVIDLACAATMKRPAAERVSINLSGRQFHDPALLETVDQALRASGLSSDRLEFEITETVAMQDLERADAILQALHARGIRLLMDDFGTGHSSLSNLRRLPLHAVKIDRSFVSDLPGENRARGIVTAIIAMAHHLGLEVIAEGVETEEQLAFLKAEGCDSAQGFLLGRPE
jgi:diguanylate cyclase (GGDEF)-like protein/PAS domain S-box-containing protein